jgi:hypothetical protein
MISSNSKFLRGVPMLIRSGFKSIRTGLGYALKSALLFVLIGLWSYSPHAVAASIVAVDPPQKGRSDAPPIMTLLYGVDNPQTTVILLPGGKGQLNFKEDTKGTRNATALMLQYLTRADFPKLRTNVVVVDSPIELYQLNQRRSADHLDRIESVVLYYKKKFNTPIWLLGHSNGSVSVTEFINRSSEARSLITGVIASGSRFEIEIQNGVNLPILFLHHERDGCKNTPYSYARTNFEKASSRNKSVTEFAIIRGGEEKGDPCRDGRHMYFGAYEEAARHVEQFILRNHPAGEKM